MEELETTLREATWHCANPVPFAMALARLEAERGDIVRAAVTLERAASKGGAQHAGFLALQAVLVQRMERHEEAVERYGAAISIGGARPEWLLGQAVSLRAIGRAEASREALRRALENEALSPELREYAEKQLALRGTGRG